MDKFRSFYLHGSCLLDISVQHGAAELMGLSGCNAGEHRNDAFCTERHERNDLIVVSGVEVKFVAVQKLECAQNIRKIAACFLHTHNVRNILSEVGGRLRLNRESGSARDVIEQTGNLHRMRNLRIVVNQTLLRRLIIIGGNQQKTVRAVLLGLDGHLDCRVRRI